MRVQALPWLHPYGKTRCTSSALSVRLSSRLEFIFSLDIFKVRFKSTDLPFRRVRCHMLPIRMHLSALQWSKLGSLKLNHGHFLLLLSLWELVVRICLLLSLKVGWASQRNWTDCRNSAISGFTYCCHPRACVLPVLCQLPGKAAPSSLSSPLRPALPPCLASLCIPQLVIDFNIWDNHLFPKNQNCFHRWTSNTHIF